MDDYNDQDQSDLTALRAMLKQAYSGSSDIIEVESINFEEDPIQELMDKILNTHSRIRHTQERFLEDLTSLSLEYGMRLSPSEYAGNLQVDTELNLSGHYGLIARDEKNMTICWYYPYPPTISMEK